MFSQTCILLYLRAIPRSSYIIFELISINEDKWTNQRNEYNQANINNSKERVRTPDGVTKNDGADQGIAVVNVSLSVAHDVSEDWSEAKDAEGDGQEGEDFGELLQSAGEEDRGEKDGVDAGGFAMLHRHADWILGFFNFLFFLRCSIFFIW